MTEIASMPQIINIYIYIYIYINYINYTAFLSKVSCKQWHTVDQRIEGHQMSKGRRGVCGCRCGCVCVCVCIICTMLLVRVRV